MISPDLWPTVTSFGSIFVPNGCQIWNQRVKVPYKALKSKKGHPRAPEVIGLTWPASGRDLIGNHGGYIVSPVFMFLIIGNQETRASWALIRHGSLFSPDMTLRMTSQVTGHWDQGHEIFRVDVKLINTKVLKVSSRYVAFNVRYPRKILGGIASNPLPSPVPARVNLTWCG